ncbi:MAG: type II toxin-antitoxin system RelE/ParE family toxin [Bdellovibrionota bacterium]
MSKSKQSRTVTLGVILNAGIQNEVFFPIRSEEYGFARKDRANIDARELDTARGMAKFLLTCSDEQISKLMIPVS